MSKPIPAPPGLPFVGNLFDVQDEIPLKALEHLADIYGPIYKISISGGSRVVVSSSELFDELCDETRFCKSLQAKIVAPPGRGGPTGLFTAPSENDPDWGQAHRVLVPAFGPLAIQDMYGEMHDIASQLILKWARLGPEYKIPVTSDFTRLTLDTIALCAMDFRFNSFYQDEMHPFILAMNNTLSALNDDGQISHMARNFFTGSNKQLQADRKLQAVVAGQLVANRRAHPTDKKDLLNAMINGKDPKTGEKMRDGLIVANMITFLIAGHETTSGLLSFAFLKMLKNPAVLRAAQQEVDQVVGKSKLSVSHLKDLKYITAILRETLRLHPTVPIIARCIRPENQESAPTLGKGQYSIHRDDLLMTLLTKVQKDPVIYGEDADEFKPERMLDENFDKLPQTAWKPFGTGIRGCIGRAFAWQEALLVTAMVLQNFNLRLDDPKYELRIYQMLTIKPKDLYMHATLREGINAIQLQESLASTLKSSVPGEMVEPVVEATGIKPICILYGSNTGTCQAFGQQLASESRHRGFGPTVMEMDAAVDKLPIGQPVVIITASYEGQPPDNAMHFVNWITSAKEQNLAGLDFAVFGCGHSDWSATFQRIPTLVDDVMQERGGSRIVPRGLSNAANGDMFSDFDNWSDSVFWPAMAKKYGDQPLPDVESKLEIEMFTDDRASRSRQDVRQAKVMDSRVLTTPGEPIKRHLEILLPSNTAYKSGDYLAILPLNANVHVQRAMTRFSIPWDAVMSIKGGVSTTIPTDTPLIVKDLLAEYVELCQPATRKDLATCIEFTDEPADKAALEAKLRDYTEEILKKRVSVLDLLELFPSTSPSFGSFLGMLPPMRLRYYSISSSPLGNPTTCTITYSVVSEPSPLGPDHAPFMGVASTYLSTLEAGSPVYVSVRPPGKSFHLPLSTSTPILMLCAGTGVAPFRGFVQERAMQLSAGQELAPALLFVGCRWKARDRLYADEFDAWAKQGAVDVRYAFSRESDGCKYVQDRVAKDKEDVFKMWDQDARVYVCGSPQLAEAVGAVGRELVKERAKAKGNDMNEEGVEKWMRGMRNERFVTDVFA